MGHVALVLNPAEPASTFGVELFGFDFAWFACDCPPRKLKEHMAQEWWDWGSRYSELTSKIGANGPNKKPEEFWRPASAFSRRSSRAARAERPSRTLRMPWGLQGLGAGAGGRGYRLLGQPTSNILPLVCEGRAEGNCDAEWQCRCCSWCSCEP